MIRWFEHRQVYAPSRILNLSPEAIGRPFEDVQFASGDGTQLHGWFLPAVGKSLRTRLVLLVMHGNGGNISHRLHFYDAWLELGLNVFAFDYQGYGQSAGHPGEEATYQDALGAMRWLIARGFSPEHIIPLGKSLGGGVAAELAIRAPVGGLILQSTFTSIPELGSELFPWLPVRLLHSIRYATCSKLPRVSAPVMILHSRKDNLIGFHHAQQNFNAIRSPRILWEIAGNHTNVIEAGRREYLIGLERFIAGHLDPVIRKL